LGDLSSVDTKELGEAIDMIKDLSEAIYYCTVTEAMEHKSGEKDKPIHAYRDMDKEQGRMYYDGYPVATRNYPVDMRDYREGRSPMTRKMYMEHKELHHGKEVQIQELEKYMQELSHDLTEMIEDSSIEEKQMLQRKLTALAAKIV
jgi:hypothetical protein